MKPVSGSEPSGTQRQDAPRILYLSPYSPRSPDSGGKLRVASLSQALETAGILRMVVVGEAVAGNLEPEDLVSLPAMSKFQRLNHYIGGIVRQRPIRGSRFLAKEPLSRLGIIVKEFKPDVLLAGDLNLFPLARELLPKGAKLLVDTHNVESLHNRSIAIRARRKLEALKYKALARDSSRIERSLVTANQVWAVSREDEQWYREHLGIRNLRVIPNSVNPAAYADGGRVRDPRSVSFLGWFRHPPNEEAALELIAASKQLTSRGHPHHLVLIGRDPTSRMRRAARRLGWVTVTGAVSDVRPHLAGSGVFAAPILSGGGTKLKILEAMAMGCAVITTPDGARGIGLGPNEQAVVVSADEFADSLHRLIDDPIRQRVLGDAARRFILRNYSPEIMGERVREAIVSVLGEDPGVST